LLREHTKTVHHQEVRPLLLLALLAPLLLAQTSTVRGVVTDDSGAIVPGALVKLTPQTGAVASATTGANGAYVFLNLAPGAYTLEASAPQLSQEQAVRINTVAGTQVVNLRLKVASTKQEIVVEDNASGAVTTDAAGNANAVVLRGDDLAALSDNPEDLQADLQALAGPSAGPGGGSIFIDGFSGGEIPPKDTIREVRINQNPFSPEYDKLGLGRIEILTKPGSDRYRASLNYNLGTDKWNSRNPYSAQKAPLLLNEFENTLGGPINKRASFALDANQNNVDNGAIVNAVTLDPRTLTAIPLFENYKAIQRRTRITPRIDYQLSSSNTLTVRYGFTYGDIQGSGIGGFNVISRGFHTHYTNELVQVIDTVVHGSTVNETRFQYYRDALQQLANSTGPAIQVLGSFNGGASQLGQTYDTQNTYELQNNTMMVHGSHAWRFGLRLRAGLDDNVSPQNFNGAFTFSGGLAPMLDANNQPVVDSAGNAVLQDIGSLERYRRTLLFQQMGLTPAAIRLRGGGASQFSISAGRPELTANQIDIGVFAGDDWRLRPNLTLNLGVRFEDQTNIHDGRNFAPRVGLAWAPGSTAGSSRPKVVLRAGFGIFYDRFALGNTLAAERYNGIVQQQYVIPNPDFFPAIPPQASLAGFQAPQVVQEVSAALRAPYVMQSAFTVERQLPRNTTVAVTYTNTRGLHELRSRDLNAPLPGTYDPAVAGSGVYPLGSPGALFLMESSGVYNQNQLLVNATTRVTPSISLSGSYVVNRANANTDGVGTFPANPYNYDGEYGPAAADVHQRVSVNGSVNTKWNVRFSPLVSLQSGAPFDITAGSDLYGTTLFNGRPGIATDPSRPGLIRNQYGLFDPNPTPGEKPVGRNFGRGPGQMSVNLRVAKTFGFGAESGSARKGSGIFVAPRDRRYNLIISMSMRNLLNHTNPGPIIGNITSPLFGLANQMAGNVNGEGFSENANNRRLELQTRFTF
jgi:hypothetical protein